MELLHSLLCQASMTLISVLQLERTRTARRATFLLNRCSCEIQAALGLRKVHSSSKLRYGHTVATVPPPR